MRLNIACVCVGHREYKMKIVIKDTKNKIQRLKEKKTSHFFKKLNQPHVSIRIHLLQNI